MKNIFINILVLLALIFVSNITGQTQIELKPDGTIPVWLANGPFEIKTVGFGDLPDEQTIDEIYVNPEYGKSQKNLSVEEGVSDWLYLSAKENGFADFNEYYGWKTFNTTEKIWYAKIIYAFAKIYSGEEQKIKIKFGGNTIVGITFNGDNIYKSLKEINSVEDNFSDTVTLQKGENRLLIKIANTHKNHSVAFWDPIRYEWGFYCRLTGLNDEVLSGVFVSVDKEKNKPGFNITPTFFYKKIDGKIKQKYFVEINSPVEQNSTAVLSFKHNNNEYKFTFEKIGLGVNQREIYLPEPGTASTVSTKLILQNISLDKKVELKALPKYELYFMPTTHMDIGYTNSQPVVIERQIKTLDQVIEKCESDKNFKWTIETMWLLDNYKQSRSKEKFDKLIALIKKGRIAVSPIYSNPFTGWISETEMVESFRAAEKYKKEYGIEYFGALYNDVPGQSWALSQALKKAGVKVLVDGINEIFADYKFQKSLPKVFNWVGSNNDTIPLYLTEAYVEGLRYGLERDISTIAYRIWHRVNNIIQREYPFTKILISGAFSDNSGIALNQYDNAIKWNTEYAYPKFVISTLNDFCKELYKGKLGSLKTVKGDWTSDWDILNQGEIKRMIKYRWVQNHLPPAEILSTFSSLQNPGENSFGGEIDFVYNRLLNYSGHGSGLEYGFGSKQENMITEEFRSDYVQTAYLKTEELLERITYRLTAPKESFDSHGMIVFNTLSWNRTTPVEIEFPQTDLNNYDVIDLSNNKKIDSYRTGAKLYFIADNVPGIGYKQYQLVNSPATSINKTVNGNEIENEYFKIRFEESGLSIIEKLSGDNILDNESKLPSFVPVRKRFQLNEKFSPIIEKLQNPQVEKNVLFEEIAFKYQNEIFSGIKFRLWKNQNKIDVALQTNLYGLKETEYAEEYGLPFAFNTGKGKVLFETLGGLTSIDDRFKAVGHNFMPVRRSIGIENQKGFFMVASTDCRVFVLDTLDNRNILIANVLNNFPEGWNRNEDKTGSPEFKFSITSVNQTNPDITVFGLETTTEPVVRRSWYKKDAPVQQFLHSSNSNIKVVSIRPLDEKNSLYELTLQNSSADSQQEITLTSDVLFSNSKVSEINYLGENIKSIKVENNSITLKISSNSIKKILVQKYH
ncbi:MAG: hypothetical protein AB1521_00435 [Bacteroidota bacterium]